MFTKKYVIGIDRNKLVFAQVSAGGKGKIVRSFVTEYDFVSIRETLNKAVKKFKIKKIRILLADELSYCLTLKPGEGKDKIETIRDIKRYIEENIPEKLTENDWDYVRMKKGGEIFVFAPVKNLYQRIVEVLKGLKVDIEAVEPEVYAKKRNSNPLIGIAKKKDIDGKEDEVLNLIKKKSIKFVDKTEGKEVAEVKGDVGGIKLQKILAVILILLIPLAGYLLFKIYYKSDKPLPQSNENEQQNIATPTTREVSGSVEKVDDQFGEYKLLLENASGNIDLASSSAEILNYEGFEDIRLIQSSESADTKTFVQLKDSTSLKVYATIERALNSDFDVQLSEYSLPLDGVFDVKITLGLPLIK